MIGRGIEKPYPPKESGSAGGLAERDVKELVRMARMGLLVDAPPPKR